MHSITRFESNLLKILRCLLRRAPMEQFVGLVLIELDRPPCLSRACVDLIQNHLTNGCLEILVKGGGWKAERFLAKGQVRSGRLWERTDPEELGLTFSLNSLRLLVWLTGADPRKRQLKTTAGSLTLGDLFLLFLTYDALRTTEVRPVLQKSPLFASHALLRLAFPEDFYNRQEVPDFTPWFDARTTWLLETLQPWLAERWLEQERSKPLMTDWQEMHRVGAEQIRILESFRAFAEQTGRRDLARFMLMALSRLLQNRPQARDWVKNLTVGQLRVADRMSAYQSALGFLTQIHTLAQWTQQTRNVSYLDREEYAASQLWKSDWDRWNGDQLVQIVQGMSHDLDPLQQA